MFERKIVDVAIIGAMTEEVEALLTHVTNCTKHQKRHFLYYMGQINQKNVVVFQSGIGKVGAAVTTTFLLEYFAPKYLINIGSAGGFDKNLAIGDVVISSEVAYHDVDVTLCGTVYGQIPGMPSVFTADQKLISLAKKSINKLPNIKAMEGLVCTGDFFMAESGAVKLARSRFPSMIAAEMEAAAVAHVCYLYQQPFVVIRAISDLVEQEGNKVDFFTFLPIAAKNSAAIVADMLMLLSD